MVSGPRSSSSLHCVCNACEITFATSEMASPLVPEGAMVSEGQYTASVGFGAVSGPRSSCFFALRTQCLAPRFRRGLWFWKGPLMHCIRNAWPPVSEVAVVLEALMRTQTKCPCSRPGAGACAVLRALLLRALGSPSRQKSLRWRVHYPLWHKFCHNQAAIELSPMQHAQVSYHTE